VKLALSLAVLALAACSAATPASSPIEHGPDSDAAIAAAKLCVKITDGVTNDGYTVVVDEATARRDPADGSRWLVEFPAGQYMGRLPPPHLGSPLVLAVEPGKSGQCTTVPPTPPAP
jgi:hypothetical protein